MVRKTTLVTVALFILAFSVLSQVKQNIERGIEVVADSITVNQQEGSVTIPLMDENVLISGDSILNGNDTVAWLEGDIKIPLPAEAPKEKFKPNSTKAILYTAILPGMGQIYNKKYWKLPIVYGGVVGLVYALTWNGRVYNDYTTAYRAIMSDDWDSEDNRAKWTVLFNRGNDLSNITQAQLTNYRERIRRNRDNFRRNRDLSIIGIVGLYAICMIDAYVDAELFDFDMSNDLTFRVGPVIMLDSFSQKSFGIQCNIIF